MAGVVDGGAGRTVADGAGEAATGSSKNILDLVPLDNTVSVWTVDPEYTKTPGERATIGTTEAELKALIGDSAAEFYRAPYTPEVFAWQTYVNSTLPAPCQNQGRGPPLRPGGGQSDLIMGKVVELPEVGRLHHRYERKAEAALPATGDC
jgi:hypothetical protein